jgi:hypothetical protein
MYAARGRGDHLARPQYMVIRMDAAADHALGKRGRNGDISPFVAT